MVKKEQKIFFIRSLRKTLFFQNKKPFSNGVMSLKHLIFEDHYTLIPKGLVRYSDAVVSSVYISFSS